MRLNEREIETQINIEREINRKRESGRGKRHRQIDREKKEIKG